MKTALWLFLVLSLTVVNVFAQVDMVKQEAELNSAKGDLEDARKVRDQVVANRWQERKLQNEEREQLAEKLRETREKLDVVAAEKVRLFEEVKATREEIARLKVEAEDAKAQFFTVSDQSDKIESLEKFLNQGASYAIPERIQKINNLRKEMQIGKDDPGRVAGKLLYTAVTELEISRQIVLEDAELVFDGNEAVRGQRIRLGLIGGVQYAPEQKRAALLLAQAGEKGRMFSWQSNIALPINEAIGKAMFQAKDSSHVLLPVDVLLSTSLGAQMAEQTELGIKESFDKWMKDGGFLMYFILGLGAFALLLTMERLLVIVFRGYYSKKQLKKIFALATEGKIAEAKLESEKMRGAMGRVVRAIFRHPEGGRESAEKSLEEVFVREVPALERRLSSISVMGASAPLLGLLGTVMGMIELFKIITLYGTNDPKLLAGGIAVALITTQAGLIVAIPIQLMHTWISNRIERLTNRLESTALHLLNLIWIK